MIKKLFLILFLALVGIRAGAVEPAPATEINVTVMWDNNKETDIAKYRVYYGEQSGNYDTILDVDPSEQLVENGVSYPFKTIMMPLGIKFYFAVTAVNEADLESMPSVEVSYTTPSAPEAPKFPIIIRIHADGTIEVLTGKEINTQST